jgi:hypothetical protein
MGAIAEAFAAYAQPLVDQTDGSLEQVQKAFLIAQFCYNLGLTPPEQREKSLASMQEALEMNDEEFGEFQRDIVLPMVERHQTMFGGMSRLFRGFGSEGNASSLEREIASSVPPPVDRYAPCPCNSGEKYKFCCGKKRR